MADKSSEHLQQSTSKRKQKRKIKLVSDQKLKIAEAESCSLCKTLQKGNDSPQISRKPPTTLPTKDVNVEFDGSPGQSTVRPTFELPSGTLLFLSVLLLLLS